MKGFEAIDALENEVRRLSRDNVISFYSSFPQVSIEEVATSTHSCHSIDINGEVTGINFSHLNLNAVPSILSHFTNLRILRLFGTSLTSLPSWLTDLQKLTSLYLSHNHFEELPPVIGELKSLEVLAINGNRIDGIPAFIEQLSNLKKLGLSGNNLSTLPEILNTLFNLESLFLAHNKLTELPARIAELRGLKELSLSYNPISNLPANFNELTNLRLLSLRETSFTELPSSVFKLSNLEDLDISGTVISHLPSDIGSLTTLKRLNLSATQLRNLPSSMTQLQELRFLNLSSLKFVELPSEIFRLHKLTELNLSSTRTRFLPAEIGRLTELERLDLSAMGLTSIPAVTFKLKKLTRLNLAGNRLRELPPQITESPLEIFATNRRNPNREGINLEGNPLESPPLEIVLKGTHVVHTYFRSLKSGRKSIDEVKVLLVGDGGSGKTSLVKRLTGQGYDENEPQTHGININDFPVNAGGKRIKVHFWDFGGQEIMHATHQFFLSKRSAYILVLDGRKDEKTEYWLKHIEAFGGESPILIVMNKIDQSPSFDVNRRFLSDKYRSIRSFYRVSCHTNSGIDNLQKELSFALARVDHTKTFWAANWFKIKERIEVVADDYISYSKFRDICNEESVTDLSEQETLADFLHDLGAVLRFKDLPLRDTNVINPRWLTAGVYRIVNSEEVAEAGGILNLDLLYRLLDQNVYPPEKHNFIIELMKKFELCFEIDRNSVLLPALLPVEEPKVSLPNEDLLRFFIDYDFFPKSVMPRFIVRMHNDIHQDLRWRTGVVLQNDSFNSRAIIRADEIDRRIEIIIHGEQRRDYLGVILHAFRGINESFERLRYSEKVPMPDQNEVTISYNHLLRLASKGIRTYMPDGTEKEYDVQELLGSVKPEKPSEEEIIEILRALRDKNDTEASLLEKANKSLLLQPNFFGLGFNLNELIKLIVRGRAKEGDGA